MPKNFYQMTELQKQVALGTLLGDASLTRPSGKANSHLSCYHAIKQREWLILKCEWLHPLSRPIAWCAQLDKRDGKVRQGGRFHTRSTEELTEIAQLLYPNKRKTISQKYLQQIVDPIALTCLICDDGHWDTAGIQIATKQFSQAENELLADFLADTFHINVQPKHSGKYWHIRITSSSVERVRTLCLPSCPPSLTYKFGPVDYMTRLVEKTLLTCPICTEPVLDYASNGRIYCSRRCAGIGKPTGYARHNPTGCCERCGGVFIAYNNRQTRCQNCRGLRLVPLPCPVCGTPVLKQRHRACSMRCNVILGHRHRQ